RHTRFSRDWSSDVCSSDLTVVHQTESLVAAAGNQQVDGLRMGVGGVEIAARVEREAERIGLAARDELEARTVRAKPIRVAARERSEERRVGKESMSRWWEE